MVKHLFLRICFTLSLLLFAFVAGYAQEGVVKGTVTDATDGTTLPQASVIVKGTTIGTVTDIDGNYSISVEPFTILIVSYLGYITQEIEVQPNTTVDFALQPSALALEEIVVIGYGVQKKEDATGSVTAIDSDEFNAGAITSPEKLVTGKVPGVSIVNDGGAPGASSTIRIRGGSSLSATNDPLIVIDGVPVDNQQISGMRNPLNLLNPNDIESVTVLKDASATAIYGSRASNGVLIITTKKAQKGFFGEGSNISVTYNGKVSYSTIPKMLEVYGADEFRQLVTDRYPSQVGLLGNASTDWQDEIYDNAFGQDHYLSIAAYTKYLPIRFSYGYSNNNGILMTDNLKRNTLGLNLNPSFFDDHLQINLNAKAVFIKNHFADRGAIGAAIQYDPTKPVHSDVVYHPNYQDGDSTIYLDPTTYGGYYAWIQQNGSDLPVGQGSSNPVAMLNQRIDESNVNRILGNIQFDYKFHFLPELRANLNLGYDYSKSDGNIYVGWDGKISEIALRPISDAAFSYDPLYGGGVDNYYEQEKKNELLDFYLNYVKDVDAINSRIDIMAGYSWQHFYRKNYSINSNIKNTPLPGYTDTIDDPTEYYLLSYFGRFNYTFNNRYLLTFTLRNDNTSRFAKGNRDGWFPSVAFAWKLDQEGFMSNLDALSQLKIRVGWGVTGQQDIGQGDYPYLAQYTFSQPDAYYQLGNVFYRTLRAEGYDDNIKWEETETVNIGLDFGFFKNRIYGSFDYYIRTTKDLINEIPVPAGTNLTNYILTNVGDLENRGFEFSIMTRPVATAEVDWEIGLNATVNKNEITKLTAIDDPDYPGVPEGFISGGVGNRVQIHSTGFPSYSYYVYEQVYGTDGKPIQGMYVDRNGDGQITDDDRYHYKSPNPDFWFGISSRLNYKNWDFGFSGRASFGNYVYNNIESENSVYERLYRPEGPYLGNITTTVTNTDFVNPQYLSDYYVQDGSFFRMDYITLGYLFKGIISGKANLHVSFTCNNAFLISDYEGIDPEIHLGLDNRIYPRPRVWVFGLNLQF